MHEVNSSEAFKFLGVLILEVKFLLKSFIYEEKFFKISELNTMIDQFEYGYMDKPKSDSF